MYNAFIEYTKNVDQAIMEYIDEKMKEDCEQINIDSAREAINYLEKQKDKLAESFHGEFLSMAEAAIDYAISKFQMVVKVLG